MYCVHAKDIYCNNRMDALNLLREKYATYLDWEIIIESAELMDYLLVSDPFLLKIDWLLNSFKTMVHVEEDEIRKKESHLQYLLSQSNRDLKTVFESESDPAIVSCFIDIVLMKIQSSRSLDSACEYLTTQGFNDMEATLRGGVPYCSKEVLASHCSLKVNDFILPDFMTFLKGHADDVPGHGNQNWLIFLRSLQEFTASHSNSSKRKLTSFLSSDYHAQDQYLSRPLDKLYNILRVSGVKLSVT